MHGHLVLIDIYSNSRALAGLATSKALLKRRSDGKLKSLLAFRTFCLVDLNAEICVLFLTIRKVFYHRQSHLRYCAIS